MKYSIVEYLKDSSNNVTKNIITCNTVEILFDEVHKNPNQIVEVYSCENSITNWLVVFPYDVAISTNKMGIIFKDESLMYEFKLYNRINLINELI